MSSNSAKKASRGEYRDLPIEQRGPFEIWLQHQGAPFLDDIPLDDQDGAWVSDYVCWLEQSNLPVPADLLAALRDRRV